MRGSKLTMKRPPIAALLMMIRSGIASASRHMAALLDEIFCQIAGHLISARTEHCQGNSQRGVQEQDCGLSAPAAGGDHRGIS
ncbi:hypothetical protein [Sphingobium chungbukense]|uniref:hypothetical protein n=1 Tax=Sphingobium chungbukense TaxID=56193 RepID=UPI001E4CA402|nr:hypothetical protein [Sphingobium chungbukense]